MASILSQLAREDRLAVVESLAVDSPKTKLFAQKLKAWARLRPAPVLVITDKLDENLYPVVAQPAQRAARRARYADPVSLVRFKNVLVTKGAVASSRRCSDENAVKQPAKTTPSA